ncbi:MAG: transglutaminase-like cysteine peptidase [Desulfobulbaceae bacterium]|nr:transglutaminase-like cysteine peptidase [Desulfobulbaceae bacterium]
MNLTKAVPHIFYTFFIFLLFVSAAQASSGFSNLFGYKDEPQSGLQYLPQWLSVLERHIIEDVPEGNCTDTLFNRCHLKNWYIFLSSIRNKPVKEQIQAVNAYANKKNYVLDISNYGQEDYWAIAKEFFYNGGDCEDYAITKFFSLRWLGFDKETFRIVILQDANLRIPHAILAVSYKNDILILDNQTQRVVSHRAIAHYLPLYSVNEKKWWLHLPKL